MEMLDSINCEPYGYIKYDHDDVYNAVIIDEVEDIKQITEDVEIIEVETIEDIELVKVETVQTILTIISNKSCPMYGIPDYIYIYIYIYISLQREFSNNNIDN